MRILALDVGKRRTGVAFADKEADFVIALQTISHGNIGELIEAVLKIIEEKKIDELAIGLPLKLDGLDGEQSLYVRTFAETLAKHTPLPQRLIDERYTSSSASSCMDPDAVAACQIAEMALSKPNN